MPAAASPLARLRRALEHGSLIQAEAAARECGRLELGDALGLVLLLLDKHDPRYERAALRWLGRLLVEHPRIGFEAADEALGALRWLGGPYADVARARLALLLRRIGDVKAARMLEREVQ
jgi:hypothetical protein